MIVPPLSPRDITIHQQALAGTKVNMARLSAVGGVQWTVIRKKDTGIGPAVETTLGTIWSPGALAPMDATIVAGPGTVLIQRDAWSMIVPLPAAVALRQGLRVQSVELPSMRFLITAVDDTDNPGYLDLTLEPV